MQTPLRLCGIFALILLGTAVQGQGKNAPSYYPLQVGNQWIYKVTLGDNSNTAVTRIARIETVDKVPLAKLEAKNYNGLLVATEHLLQTDQGVFRYRNNDKEINPPICLLNFAALKKDKTWGGETKMGNEKGKYSCEAKDETVEVPAGKFAAIRVAFRLDSKAQSLTTTYWFAKDVGIVKQSVDAGGLSFLMELEKFEPAK